MDAALIGKGRMPLRLAFRLARVPPELKARSSTGDVAFELLDMLGLFLDDGFDQISDR
jgi:hypothetical protein